MLDRFSKPAALCSAVCHFFISEGNTESCRQVDCCGSCHHVPVRYLSNMQGHNLTLHPCLFWSLPECLVDTFIAKIHSSSNLFKRLLLITACSCVNHNNHSLFCTCAPAYSPGLCQAKPLRKPNVIGWRWCNVLWQTSRMFCGHFWSNWPCWEYLMLK